MSKKCCKDNGPKYVVSTMDNSFIECEPMTKEEAEDEVADMLNDYEENEITVYRLEKVDFETRPKDVEVEIID